MGYLEAGLLEPLIAIGSTEEGQHPELLLMNLLQLFSLCAWLYLLNDAFDTSDVSQAHAIRGMRDEAEAKGVKWLKLQPRAFKEKVARHELAASTSRDFCLWFVLLCIGAACAGVVRHRDVIHSYALVLLWLVLHHRVYHGTQPWNGMGYVGSFFFPSAALMPMEYCLALTQQDSLEDLDGWRLFIKERTLVDLIIEA